MDSVLNQSLKVIEIIIVDGSSSDETLSIVQSYQSPSIKLLIEKDDGVYDAMNKGIAMATGEWLYFLGSDDRMYGNSVLYNIAMLAKNTSASLIYGNVIIEGESIWAKDGQVYDGEYSNDKILRSNICHQAIFYKRQIITENGGYNKKYRICADWDLNIKFFSKEKIQYSNEIIAFFSGSGKSSLKAADEFLDSDYVINVTSYFNWTPFNSHFRKWRHIIKKNAHSFYKRGKILAAAKFMSAYFYHSIKS